MCIRDRFYRSKNASIGSNTIVAADDSLGRIDFRGYNTSGNSYNQGATIEARVDGSVNSSTDMPTRLEFKTSQDGSASPTERLCITSTGDVLIGGHTQGGNDGSKLSVYDSGSNIGIIQVHCGTEGTGDLAGIAFGQGGSGATARAKAAIAAVDSGSYGRTDLCFYVDGTADNLSLIHI